MMTRHAGWLTDSAGNTFVQLHQPAGAARANSAVIIVPALGHEYFHGYRAMRFLADSLSEAGLLTLRMDFAHTGNAGEPAGSRPELGTWHEDLARAIRWLRAQPGVTRLCFVAHRSAALLIRGLHQPDDDMVLWNPALSGRAWLREIMVLRNFRSSDPTQQLEVDGLCLDHVLREAISGLDVLRDDQPARHTLLIERADRPLPEGMVSRLRDNAPAIDVELQHDHAASFREPHHTSLPRDTVQHIVTWSRRLVTATVDNDALRTRAAEVELMTDIRHPGHRERVLWIDGLFGVLTEPVDARSIVLLGNTGATHTAGVNRLNVELARALAAAGIASLRYDLANLGDSVTTGLTSEDTIEDENYPYPQAASRDIERVVTWARSQGYRKLVLAGLCSSAYAAFDFTRGAGAKPDELLLINPLTFQWHEGMSLDVPQEHSTLIQSKVYRSAMTDPSRWRRLLTGQVEYGRLLRHVVNAVAQKAVGLLLQSARRLRLVPAPRLARELQAIAVAGTRLHFYFASNDPGYEILNTAGKASIRVLEQHNALSIRHFAQADHTFRDRDKRSHLIESILEDLEAPRMAA